MRFFALALCILATTAQANDCLKPGQQIELYGAVDLFHFFHGGNGMRVASTVLRLDRHICVEENGPASRQVVNSMQLMTEKGAPGSDLVDGDLVKLKGTFEHFGDTFWYSPYPLLRVNSVVKKYATDPAEDEILGR